MRYALTLFGVLCIASVVGPLATAAEAEKDYPTKPIRLVIS